MDESTGKSPSEYLAILRRHKLQIIAVSVAMAAAAFTVAVALPPVYRSSAVILVQEQEVPPDLVRSTVTSFADERIQVISQRVMTRAVLLPLIEKHDLYEKYRGRQSNDQIVERMRKDITLTTVDANVSDRSSGRRVNATIAFEISYDSPYPDRAQKVVAELVSLYLAENVKARQESVAETTTFLAEEADRMAKQIQEIEANLASFKRRYGGRTPDLWEVNRQLAERTGSELLSIEREISMLQDRKLSLEAQLQLIPPNSPLPAAAGTQLLLTPKERLRALEAEYAKSASVFGPDYPDMRRMRREIAALKEEVAAASDDGRSVTSRPDNPAFVALTTQLENTKREVIHMTTVREELRAKQRTYDEWLAQMPEIEREYNDLTRDYDNAKARYRDVKAKQMDAEVAQELEKERKAERFSVGEPASLPINPTKPKRLQLAMIGLVGALGSGIGLAWLRDAIDPSVKGPLELARITRLPMLTPIPYIETRRERERLRRRNWILGWMLSLLWAVVLVGLYFFLKSR